MSPEVLRAATSLMTVTVAAHACIQVATEYIEGPGGKKRLKDRLEDIESRFEALVCVLHVLC